MSADRLTDQFSHLIATLSRRLEEQLEARFAAEGVPIDQWRVLAALVESNGQTMSGLAAKVLVEAPSLTKVIDRMVSDGLVFRAPDSADRRKVLVFLSARGVAVHNRLNAIAVAQQHDIVARLGTEGAGNLRDLIGLMLSDQP